MAASASRFNGSSKIIISALVGLLAGGVSAGIFFGSQSATIKDHVESKTIHESPLLKEQRIDSRVRLHLAPIDTEIRQMRKQLDRIEGKL